MLYVLMDAVLTLNCMLMHARSPYFSQSQLGKENNHNQSTITQVLIGKSHNYVFSTN